MKTISKNCPCKSENHNNFILQPNIKKVFITVHGTFARHAEWTYHGKLIDELSTNDSQFCRFCWSGNNSHSARLQASEELKVLVDNLTSKFEHIHFYIICHSHGGNVVMYTMKKIAKSTENKIRGVITLATPFLNVKLRKDNPLIQLSCLILSIFFILELYINSNKGYNLIGLIYLAIFLLWFLLTIVSVLIYKERDISLWTSIKLLFGINKTQIKLKADLSELDLSNREEKAKSLLDEKKSCNILVIRPFGDEATMSLVVPQFFSWILNAYLNWLSFISKQFIYSVYHIWLVVIKFAEKIVPSNESEETQNRESIKKLKSNKKSSLSESPSILSMLISVIFLIGMIYLIKHILLPELYLKANNLYGIVDDWLDKGEEAISWSKLIFRLIVLPATAILLVAVIAMISVLGLLSLIALVLLIISALPFGWDSIFWAHFASTTSEASPPGSYEVFHPYNYKSIDSNNEPSLAHSSIYENEEVINKIKSWIS